jgi:NAD(P)-dependent dehydrogenase (short-subunit alcohol dehydrogenase family)
MATHEPATSQEGATGVKPVALVTGAARGLGLGFVRAFARAHYDVVLIDVEPSVHESAAAVSSDDANALGLVADVTDRDEFAAAIDATVARFGRLDVLVNNAQTGGARIALLDTSPERLDATWRSGFVGTVNGMQLAHPHLVRSKGCIINLVSGAALAANAGYGVYASTKSAIKTITHVAAMEWGPAGVRVNAISPSARTEALDEWARANPHEYEVRRTQIPLGRFGDPETDIGAVAVFLASPAASYITGQTIVVDGGAYHL